MNRLNHILKLCQTFPITFRFVPGFENPADYTTRPVSYNLLIKSNYLTGPDFLKLSENGTSDDRFEILVPSKCMKSNNNTSSDVQDNNSSDKIACGLTNVDSPDPVIDLENFSTFHGAVQIMKYVFRFINKIKLKLKLKNKLKYAHIEANESENCHDKAFNYLVRFDQLKHFPEVFEYFQSKSRCVKDIPNIVSQLNLFIDSNGVIRIKSKYDRKTNTKVSFPILLSKHSRLARLIIMDLHRKRAHAGCYTLLAELRKSFWITHYFSVVKRVIRECVACRRFNNRPLKLNQSPYREFRIDPSSIPFNSIFIDHLGPYFVKKEGKKTKVWILIVTCLWSRAINLKICHDLSVKEFLRAFQLHTFEVGVPSLCLSDLGSQIVAGANVVTNFINDFETQNYFQEQGIKPLKFDHYYKGCHNLGSLVESCVKLSKRLIYGSIKNWVLDYFEFEFFICQTVHFINRRPVAFKDALRDSDPNAPEPITPEELVRGYPLTSLNLIPELQSDDDSDPEWHATDPPSVVKNNYEKLQSVRQRLKDLYHSEFQANLVHQAINEKDRYKPVVHKSLNVGDVVLLKEPLLKPHNFPMGIVKKITFNEGGEVTGAIILKGSTREEVKRHANSIIPLLGNKTENNKLQDFSDTDADIPDDDVNLSRPRRAAAEVAAQRLRAQIDDT